MLDELILHIGTPKTGSTSIQRVLARNTDALKNAGVLYPDSNSNAAGHPEVAWALNGRVPKTEKTGTDVVAISKHFLEQAERHKIRRLFLSSEEFGLLSPPNVRRLRELLPAEKYRIIMFARRQDAYLEAAFKQQMKARAENCDLDILEFYLRTGFFSRLNYEALLSKWIKAFGKECIQLSTFEAANKHPDGLLGRTLTMMDIELSKDVWGEITKSDRENVSLSAVGAKALLKICASNKLDRKSYRAIYAELLNARDSKVKTGLLSIGQRKAILRHYKPKNRQLMENYGIFDQWSLWGNDVGVLKMPDPAEVDQLVAGVAAKFPRNVSVR